MHQQFVFYCFMELFSRFKRDCFQAVIYDHIITIMADEEDQFFVEPQVQELQDFKIIAQTQPQTQHRQQPPPPSLKRIQIPKEPVNSNYYSFRFERNKTQQQEEQQQQFYSEKDQNIFQQFYSNHPCIYKRFNNERINCIDKTTYFSGLFINLQDIQEVKCSQTTQISQSINQYFDLPNNQSPLKTSREDLIFNSKFQSGNLFAVFKVSQYEYDLILSNDINSTGSIQWFYFSVMNLKQHKEYTFSIINFTKSDSLFNYGMMPLLYSLQQNNNQENVEKGWIRTGKNVQYIKSKINRQNSHRKFYYKLIFTISTAYPKDKLYIAHSYPYTLQKLHKFLKEKENSCKQLITRTVIGKTISKRNIQVLTICQQMNKKRDSRKAIVIMARQHPGQSQSSYVCQGVINHLLSKTKQSELLLKNYKIYIIPMVNVDGVVFGNYRSNLLGKDLNRKWNASQRDLNCPEVICIKAFLQQIAQERQIRFILDLHGHSRKLNSFFYGNPYPENPQVVRIFPYICSKLNSCVQYFDCTFASQQYKRKAARIYLSFSFRLIHVYTFQSSFFGYFKEGKKIEFTPKEYRQLGHTLVDALYLQLQHELKYQQSYEFNLKKTSNNSLFTKYLTELRNNKILLQHGNNNYEGSDSKPEEFQVNQAQILKIKCNKEKKQEYNGKNVSKSMNIESKKMNLGYSKEIIYHRPVRRLKYIQISKINSEMPNNQLILQPIQSQAKMPLKASFSSSSQTDYKKQLQLAHFESTQIEKSKLANSFKCESKQESKLSMVIKSMNNKNSFIFKYDPFDRSLIKYQEKNTSNKYKRYLKNAFSQTMMTFAKNQEKLLQKVNNIQSFPLVSKHYQLQPSSPSKTNNNSKDMQLWPKINYLVMDSHSTKSQQKKDSQYYNQMIKKLINQKDNESDKKKIKSLSVRRKQIQKK